MKPETRSFYEQAVHRAAERIVTALDQALDLERLARDAGLSPFHFHRVFRGMVGETPLELHRRLRMERAAWRVLNDGDGITAIAFDAGYETHEAFTRAFKAQYGASPSEFRKWSAGGSPRAPQIEIVARSRIHFLPRAKSQPPSFNFIRGETAMQVEITDRPDLRVAAVQHVGAYNRISEAFGRLGAIAGQAGLFGSDASMIAIFHDDPEMTPEDKLRSDAGITVPPTTNLPTGLTELKVPGGRYARTTHKGSYDGLGDAWARLMGEWLPKSGHRFGNGVSYELYRNTPMNAAPNELLTDLYIPLE